MLLGRQIERARIERLLNDARQGRGGALVIRGEPGIGKTSLLRYAIDLAEAMTVARAVGVESEAELEYSGLVELCRPLLSGLDGLPEHQAETLRGAFGLSPTRPGDRFAVGAATLGLLALVAESRPLLVVVDDGQWVDAASVDALAFAARRLAADAVAVLVGAREGSAAFAGGFDEMTLGGLDAQSAARLLDDVSGTVVAPAVAAQVLEATRGNPLALVELPLVLSPAQLAGEVRIGEPLPVGAGVQSSYSKSVERLPEKTREALVVLAVSSSGDVDLIAAALAELGGTRALEPAEDAGLVELRDDVLVFRHPLVRSAVVQAAQPSERRQAHRTLATALARRGEDERRAWHLAAAAVGHDADAADALAAAAAKARERGGHEAAAEAYERAARLTPGEALRIERLTDAAEAAWGIGDTPGTRALVDEVSGASDGITTHARVLRLQGRMELQGGSSSRAQELFLESASLVRERDVDTSVATLGLAVFACHFGGRIAEAVEIAQRARTLAPGDGQASDLEAEYLLGRSLLLAGRLDEGKPVLERVLDGLLGGEHVSRPALMRAAIVLAVLERGQEAAERARQAVRLAREEGPMMLTYGLDLTTELAVRHGDWATAVGAAEEGLALARELGQPTVAAHFLVARARVQAARGEEAFCREAAEEALGVLGRAGMALPSEHVSCSLGLLELGLGRLDAAATRLESSARSVAAMQLHDRDVLPEPDLVEALVALGRQEDAIAALDAWLDRGGADGTHLGAALGARCRGLVAGDDAFEESFRDALERHEKADDPFAAARTRLCLGERLRRAGQRVDSRRELRAALGTFERLEAEPWVKRTRRELRATGEKLGRRAARTGDELTAQELQVALQVAEGKTNKEAGAALFLSPKTVEFHLARVYRKLEISSRAELIRRFADVAATRELVW